MFWVHTPSADMKVWKFCPFFIFLLLSSALGEDTGESKCSYSRCGYISSQHVKIIQQKKLTVRLNLLIGLFSVVKCWLFSFYSLQPRWITWQLHATQTALANWDHKHAAEMLSSVSIMLHWNSTGMYFMVMPSCDVWVQAMVLLRFG